MVTLHREKPHRREYLNRNESDGLRPANFYSGENDTYEIPKP